MSKVEISHSSTPTLNRDGVRRLIQVTLTLVLSGVILFLCAGRLDWVEGWAYLVLSFVLMLGGLVMLLRNPEVINQRARIQGEMEGWDKLISSIYAPMPFVMLILAGLDGGRYGWSEFPRWASIFGFLLYGSSLTTMYWAMSVNRFFETTVRIQEERGHKTVTAGPYRFVRHPGYSSMILMYTGAALALGSWWALIPCAAIAALITLRTRREDQTLLEELEGYPKYAKQVCYRLLPGVW